MAEKVVLNVEINDNSKSLKAQLKEAQREVQTLADKYGATSEQAIKAAKHAADLTDRIGDAKALTDAFNPDAKFKSLSASLGGVASGFSAYQGAMGLVGIESKDLEKQLLKVQSAMAISQGLQGLGESIDSFKQLGGVIKNQVVTAFSTLKGAIIATGIGALVIGIGLLIANFDKLKGALSSGLSSAKEFETSTHDNAEAARKAVTDFDNYEKTLRRLGNTEEEIADKRKKRFKEAIDQTETELKASKKVYEEQLKNLETVGTFDKLGLSATGRLLFGDEEEAKAQREKIKEVRASLEKLKNDEFEFNAKIAADKKAKLDKEKEDEINANKEKLEKHKEYLRKKKEKDDEYFQHLKDLKNQDLALVDQWNKEEQDLQAKKRQQDLDDLETFNNEAKALNEKARQEEADAEKRQDNEILAEKQKVENLKFQTAHNTLQAIGQVATAFAGKSAAEQKKAFEINKAVNIATAVMDTYKGATAALASGSEINPVFGFVSAAAVVAAGLANVATISKQQFNGGGAVSNNNNSNAPSNSNNVQAPNFSVIGNNGINQLGQIQQQPVQAYVVSGQVSTQQALDRNRVRNATFG